MLFEIGICVMTYTTVLMLEFLPVLFERPNWQKPIRIIHAITMPLVILGVVLSTLHQSSLGSLYLIMPEKLNPLWYSPLLPVFFFVSAVSVGLAMVIFESSISSRVLHRGLETHLLSKLARAIPYVLGLYLLLKFGELIVQNEIGLLFQGNLMTILFWTEIVIGALVPIMMFSLRAVRESPKGLLIGALFVIGGLMLNRFDISLFALDHLGGQSYIPNLLELAVSFGIISGGVLAFGVVAKFFPLFESGEHQAEPVVEAKTAAS